MKQSQTPVVTTAVSITYEDLLQGQVPESILDRAFGPQGLGLVCVTGGEEFSAKVREIRERFLPLGSMVDSLAETDTGSLRALEGTLDETVVESRRRQGKIYDGHWLTEPSYKSALNYKFSLQKDGAGGGEDLSQGVNGNASFGELAMDAAGFVVTVGSALAQRLDGYIGSKLAKEGAGYSGNYLATTAREGDHFVRLLSYHSVRTSAEAEEMGGYWARPHYDTSLLTGLVPGVFAEEGTGAAWSKDSLEAAYISGTLAPTSGLVVVSREGEHHKVVAPAGREVLFFQAGEAMNIISGGVVQATPHYVLGPRLQSPDLAERQSPMRVDRNTLAVFLSVREDIPLPRNMTLDQVAARTFEISQLGVRWPSLRQRLLELQATGQRFLQGAQTLRSKEYEAQLSEWRSTKFKIGQAPSQLFSGAVGGA